MASTRARAAAARTALPLILATAAAAAQDVGGGDPGASGPGAPVDVTTAPAAGGGTTVNISGNLGGPTETTTTTVTPPGMSGAWTNPDAHLPSSSRSTLDTSRSTDGFDLNAPDAAGSVARGSANGQAILGKRRPTTPAVHSVRQGDTLWDLCGGYFQNPWMWPKVWSYNPQIQNPHWIYPGDQVRLRMDAPPEQRDSIVLGAPKSGPQVASGGGFVNRRPLVPRDTVFLRSGGYIDDPRKDVWGELVGSHEEQMLLTQGNNVYMILRPGVDVRIGQLLSVFRSVRTPKAVPGARRPPGEIIAFKGAVRVDNWDPKKRVARGKLIESLDVVERGDKIGPVGRRFQIVPPRRNDADVEARVLTSFYPHEVMGQHQVVFIDKGSKDGLVAGNRLYIVRRGDEWRNTLGTTTTMARTKVRVDVPESIETEVTPLSGDQESFPEEIVGELRVIRADEQSSVTIVTSATREIETGARAVARRGY